MKTLIKNDTHLESSSHDCRVVEHAPSGTKIKMTYRAYNAGEECNICLLSQNEWKHVFGMLDLGFKPDSSAYVTGIVSRKNRAEMLFKRAVEMCELILK